MKLLRFTYTKILNEKKDVPSPMSSNIKWDFHQLIHQISLSIMNAETIKDEYLRQWILPDSLKGFVNKHPDFVDTCVYNEVLKAFYRYLKDNEEEMVNSKKSAVWIENMLRTVILVKDNKVISSSLDSKLNEELKKVVVKNSYKFTTNEPTGVNLGGMKNE